MLRSSRPSKGLVLESFSWAEVVKVIKSVRINVHKVRESVFIFFMVG
ncbi:hypothetical protein WPG_3101 [Winogradskyella sp. PG-2]|nr:hypothetical protein WPG_3101 [Winogradskyella sp. PG-2]